MKPTSATQTIQHGPSLALDSALSPSGCMYKPARELYSLGKRKKREKERQQESVRSRKSERETN